MKGKIISMGGGGFSMEPDNPLLDEFALTKTNAKCPRVCFVGTASGDSDNYISRFYGAFSQFECRTAHLSLFRPPKKDLKSFIFSHDIIYVGGGNTKNLLVLWKEWGLSGILKQYWQLKLIQKYCLS